MCEGASNTALRVHAICLALNEEPFIGLQLRTLYSFCSGISVLTQYDRDWYGNPVAPDRTLQIVADFPDPEGKIHLVLRRFPDEAAARNHEMLAIACHRAANVQPHGRKLADIRAFHSPPDYFLIVDADEIYDVETLPRILDHLARRRPRGLRVMGHNYVGSWNRRVPASAVSFVHFGFLRPGVLFCNRRWVSWNESRLQKACRMLRLPDFSGRIFGFETCPAEVGVFHHGCWLGDSARLLEKKRKSSHQGDLAATLIDNLAAMPSEFISEDRVPKNIREAAWPEGYLERTALARMPS